MRPAGPAAPVVLVTSRSFGSGAEDPEAVLTGAGLRVVRGDPGHDLEALAPNLAQAEAWLAGAAPIHSEHLARAPRLRLITRYGTGVEAVDRATAAARGITVTNTPGANAEAVAEHTLALILATLRHVVEADRAVRDRAGPPRAVQDPAGPVQRGRARARREQVGPDLVGRELASLTAGLIGLGHIGRAVARLLRALGVSVLAHDPGLDSAAMAAVGVTARPLSELVATSDVVSLHCPGGGSPVLDRRLLAAARQGLIVINTARADVVDEAALAELLHAGRIGAVAADVTGGPDSPLRTAPRTILTPHIGGHTVEAIDRTGMAAAAEIIRVLVDGAPPAHPVPPDART